MLWALAHLIDGNDLPRPRVVIRFDVTDQPAPNRFWLVIGAADREVCIAAPGYPVDGAVVKDSSTPSRPRHEDLAGGHGRPRRSILARPYVAHCSRHCRPSVATIGSMTLHPSPVRPGPRHTAC